MGILRVFIDLKLDEEKITKTQVTEITEGLADYAGSVLAPRVIEKNSQDTNPEGQWHIHKGNESCRSCRRAADDEKQ